ncbi:MAG: hypothetical protein ACXWAS_06915 [Methylobacter sp.]
MLKWLKNGQFQGREMFALNLAEKFSLQGARRRRKIYVGILMLWFGSPVLQPLMSLMLRVFHNFRPRLMSVESQTASLGLSIKIAFL